MAKINKCDVLVMIWGMVGRDVQALIPTIYLLRQKFKLHVEVRSIFDYTAIDLLKPKVLLTNCCTGAYAIYKVTKYAQQRGIYAVALHAEGVFRKELTDLYLWGNNRERKPTVDKWFLWNEDSYRWSLERFPYLKDILSVSGSAGHEKYHIFKNVLFDRSKLLGDQYDGIIFYVGWSFDIVARQHEQGVRGDALLKQKETTIHYLQSVAKQYPNKLLILKYHPATENEEKTEISHHFDQYNNVLILHDEMPVYQLIALADVVLVYESTMAVDAWLEGKTTIHLCQDHPEYVEIWESSISAQTNKQLLDYLDELFVSKTIKEFEAKREQRERLITACFGNQNQSPSKIIAEHISRHLDEKKSVQCGVSLNLFFRGLVNRFFYHFSFFSHNKRCSQMRDHYQPEAFTRQYIEYQKTLDQYYRDELH